MQEVPSTLKLARATAVAFAIAGVLLVTVILPAEYSIDPLGTGAALGLTQLSASTPAPEAPQVLDSTAALIPVVEGPVANYPAEYKFDLVEFEIGPYEYVEYKYRLEKGASMLFSWSADSEVIHDLHGDPDGAKAESSESFEKKNRKQANGMFTAPFSGIHGWFWENKGDKDVELRLTTAGFYDKGLMFAGGPPTEMPVEDVK